MPSIRTTAAIAACLSITPVAADLGFTAPGRAPEAPAELERWGQLAGTWSCASTFLNGDGEWQEVPGRATWTWAYVLDGWAVQDVWRGPPGVATPGSTGTNLRIYDREAGLWRMVWATGVSTDFQVFEATMDEGSIVMSGNQAATATRPAHPARITFHNFSDDHFDWNYQAPSAADPSSFMEYSRISCDRVR